MKHIHLTFLLFLLVSLISKAQTKDYTNFIPKGYKEYQTYQADLNNDNLNDLVIIIKKIDEKNIVINRFDKKVDRNRRGIIVLLNKEKNYQIISKNYTCFSSENEDGGIYYAPELSFEFDNGNLIIHYAHGRYGYWRYIFKYQNTKMELIAYESSSNFGPVTKSTTDLNFITKQKIFNKNINEDAEGNNEVFKTTITKIEIEKLLKLSEITNFDELEMHKY